MAEISLICDNGLPRFLEVYLDEGFRMPIIDRLKLRNGLLDALPGVVWQDLFRKKWGSISDESVVAAAFLGFVCASAYSQSLIRYDLDKKVDERTYQKFIDDLKKLLDRSSLMIAGFEKDNFWNIVTEPYLGLFKGFGDELRIPENQRINIQKYVRDYAGLLLDRYCARHIPPSTVLSVIGVNRGIVEDQLRKKEYLIRLKNQYTEVTLNDEKGITLDAIYQKPGFRIFEKCLEKGEYEKDNQAFVHSGKIGLELDIHGFVDQWFTKNNNCKALKAFDSRLMLLYGYPGQGKSSFCKRLVYDLLGDDPSDQEIYLIRLRNIIEPHELKADVLETIKAHVKRKYEFTPTNLEKSILILDGLDELLMKNKLRSEDVDEIFQNIRDVLRGHDELRVIVTSRFGYLNLEKLFSTRVLILQLEELDIDTQLQWLQVYRKFHSTWLTPEKLKEINQSGSHLKELVGQPILLHLVATLEEGLDRNVNRAKVYERLFDQITNPKKWKKDQIALLEGLEAEDLRKALQEMAYEIWRSGDGYIHKSKVRQLDSIRDIEEKLSGAGKFQDVLKFMMVAFYFQEVSKDQTVFDSEDTNQYAIEFLHKSLQEYLTAEHIWNEVLEEFLAQGRRKQYALVDENKALEVLQEIFGYQDMSEEIRIYLVQVISNHSNESEKSALAARLETFLNHFLEKDFLHSFNSEQLDHPFQIGGWVFYGYWTVLSHLQKNHYYLKEKKQRNTFAKFLRLWKMVRPLNLKNCYLEDVDLNSCCLIFADLDGAILCNANLRLADLGGASLENANLQEAFLGGAYLGPEVYASGNSLPSVIHTSLNGANLRAAFLPLADLRFTFFEGADLSGADLSGADLSGATFLNANLSKAEFRGANLSQTNLNGANLRDANFSGANLDNTILWNTENLKADQLFSAMNWNTCKGLSDKLLAELELMKEKKVNQEE